MEIFQRPLLLITHTGIFILCSGFDKELTNQKPKIKEIEFGDGGEREIIVSNQNSQIPQIQSESAQQAVVANNKPDIKLSGPQVTKKIAIKF